MYSTQGTNGIYLSTAFISRLYGFPKENASSFQFDLNV